LKSWREEVEARFGKALTKTENAFSRLSKRVLKKELILMLRLNY